jgi:hypothetical protein
MASTSNSVGLFLLPARQPLGTSGTRQRRPRGTAPFEKCDSTLKLAEQLGIGTRDLSRIELIGLPISKGKVDFRKVPQPA